MARDVFDEDYYRRFYSDKPVHTKRKIAQLAQAVDSFCQWWDLPVRSVLDVGAGPGYWRDWYKENRPRVTVHSTDVSEHACKKFGHELRDITAWRPERTYDLVICHGVLHYLADAGTQRAIEHLAAACRGVLYIEAPTSHDLEHVVDKRATDMNVRARSGQWYRRHLGEHFVQAGAGMWVSRKVGLALFELERSKD